MIKINNRDNARNNGRNMKQTSNFVWARPRCEIWNTKTGFQNSDSHHVDETIYFYLEHQLLLDKETNLTNSC